MSSMSLLLNCKPVMNIAFNLQTTFRLLMLFSAFVKAHGLAFDSKPNNVTIAATGSNQTFTWKLSLRQKDKSKHLQVQFGPWDRKYKIVKSFFMTVKQEPSGENEIVATADQSTARRLHWNGDLSRDYYIAFELVNIQRKDAGDYGIRFRVDHFPPAILQNWFSLIVQDPTPKPYIDTRHITLDVIKGDHVNITCRTSVEARSSVMWFKDKVPVYAEQSKFLSLTNVNRLQGGNYSCVSINQAGNTTSPITTINVLYEPKIHFLRKLISVVLLKRCPITLRCEADGNPSPTFYWRKDSEIIHEGFNSSGNASTLTVTPVNDKDFTLYECIAKNKIGLDALTFQLHKRDACTVPRPVTDSEKDASKESKTKGFKVLNVLIPLLVILLLFLLIIVLVICLKKRKNKKEKPLDGTEKTKIIWRRRATKKQPLLMISAE